MLLSEVLESLISELLSCYYIEY